MAEHSKGKKDGVQTRPDSEALADARPVERDAPKAGAPREIVNWPDALTNGSFDVTLHGTPTDSSNVQGFWEYMRRRTDAISFTEYSKFIDDMLCKGNATGELGESMTKFQAKARLSGVDTYELLRVATEAFLLLRCGAITVQSDANDYPITVNGNPFLTPTDGSIEDYQESRFGGTTFSLKELTTKLAKYLGTNAAMPYIDRIVSGLDTTLSDKDHPGNPIFCDDIDTKVLQPCFIELIWSYWHEEAAQVQAINAISLRFQNKRGPGDSDPLANLETHPLRPLANLLWGYVQDEDHRLTVARRSYEYEHQYGLSLVGKAVPKHAPADRRSQFLIAFHTLLHQAAIFYDRSANLTVRADAFPLLNALREVHLVLAEGAHNQFRELSWTARVEMLIQQWLLSQREVREFVGGRPAVPYAEEWMRTVDALRRLMGWGDTSISHFHDLALTGEKIVLSIRFGDWSDTTITESDAAGWAVFWRPEIQRYIHAYQAVTGVDLSVATQVTNRQIDATLPSVLLQQRMARQRR
jgi:hypothetical protein